MSAVDLYQPPPPPSKPSCFSIESLVSKPSSPPNPPAPTTSTPDSVGSPTPFTPIVVSRLHKPSPTGESPFHSAFPHPIKGLYTPEVAYPSEAAQTAHPGFTVPQHLGMPPTHGFPSPHHPAALAGVFGSPPRREPFGLYPWFLARNRLFGHRGFPESKIWHAVRSPPRWAVASHARLDGVIIPSGFNI